MTNLDDVRFYVRPKRKKDFVKIYETMVNGVCSFSDSQTQLCYGCNLLAFNIFECFTLNILPEQRSLSPDSQPHVSGWYIETYSHSSNQMMIVLSFVIIESILYWYTGIFGLQP